MTLRSLGPASVGSRVIALAAALELPPATTAAEAYPRALAVLQPWPDARAPNGGLRLVFAGTGEAEALFAHFLSGCELPELEPFTAEETIAVSEAVRESVALLEELDVEAGATFETLVQTLLVVRAPAFGGLSDALGVVLAGPEATWSRLEIAELLWHEGVHQALFLHDLLDPLFVSEDDRLWAESARIRNPLLDVDRPFDLAFHGAAVSIALVDLDVRAAAYRQAAALLDSALPTLEEIERRSEFLTGHGAAIFDELRSAAEACSHAIAEPATPPSVYDDEPRSRRSFLELQPDWQSTS